VVRFGRSVRLLGLHYDTINSRYLTEQYLVRSSCSFFLNQHTSQPTSSRLMSGSTISPSGPGNRCNGEISGEGGGDAIGSPVA
jgi:hypothetical protein